jgi:glycosyltransferase involved in cell wall biosynthesis
MDGKKGLLERTGRDERTGSTPAANGEAWHRHDVTTCYSPTISVIIPAHNEEAYLGRTLDAVNQQAHASFEVIVVANGCQDQTAAVALDRCDRLVVLSDKSLGVARNLGAKLARGEMLMFLDADTLLEPGALEAIAGKFTDNYSCGTVQGRPDKNDASFRLVYWAKNFMHCWSLHHGSSGVILCWREQFMAVNGFDEAMQVSENSDLINRLRKFGRYRYVGDTTVTTSMRRYENARMKRMVWFWVKHWIQSHFSDLRHRKYETVR